MIKSWYSKVMGMLQCKRITWSEKTVAYREKTVWYSMSRKDTGIKDAL